MIIDSHVHHYSDEVLRDPVGFANSYGEEHWKSLVVDQGGRRSLQGWANTERLLRDMDAGGVDRVILLGWYWEHQATCQVHNDWHVACIRRYPDRLMAFAAVQPRDGMSVLDDVKRAVDMGCCGIGEVFPALQGFSMRDKGWLEVVGWAVERGLPVSMHVTEPVGHDYVGRVESSLQDYLWLASEFPELKLILAHWGGLLPFYELNPKVREVLRNVYYDTSASPLLYDDRVYAMAIEAVGSEKILYGSDYPLRIFPKVQRGANFKDGVERVRGLGLKDVDCRNILGGNALRIFGD